MRRGPVGAVLDLRLEIPNWVPAGPVTLDAGGRPSFPDLPGAPGIWRIETPCGDAIGQTDNLRDRMGSYRSGRTCREGRRLVRALTTGSCRMDVILSGVFVNGTFAPLERRDTRAMVEAALRLAERPVLNRDD